MLGCIGRGGMLRAGPKRIGHAAIMAINPAHDHRGGNGPPERQGLAPQSSRPRPADSCAKLWLRQSVSGKIRRQVLGISPASRPAAVERGVLLCVPRSFRKSFRCAAFCAIFVAGLPATAADGAAKKPNIIVIVADDLGYAEVAYDGKQPLETPHIRTIATGGVSFSNGYVSCPVCSPTRAGLLTGRYQQRFGHEFNPGPAGRRKKTLACRWTRSRWPTGLKKLGYATGMVGKWHLGYEPEYHPMKRGFDEFFGFLGGARLHRQPGRRRQQDLSRHHARRRERVSDRCLRSRGRGLHRPPQGASVLPVPDVQRRPRAAASAQEVPGPLTPRSRTIGGARSPACCRRWTTTSAPCSTSSAPKAGEQFADLLRQRQRRADAAHHLGQPAAARFQVAGLRGRHSRSVRRAMAKPSCPRARRTTAP